ncbi:MAG: radical SAM protein [Eubacteriaceae bacterium]
MTENFELDKYLNDGIEDILRDMKKIALYNPSMSVFMIKFALACKKAENKRRQADLKGEHIPPFLIASISSACNLRCKGCYARQNNICADDKSVNELTDSEWISIFKQAAKLGISFILLAGGEPLMRRSLIASAGKIKDILFPVFTNGTLIDSEYIHVFSKNRNLVPIVSIEGGEDATDERRGDGVYEKLLTAMDELKRNDIIFGSSITVTSKNIEQTASDVFLDEIYSKGCRVIFYIEYVPTDASTKNLAIDDEQRMFLEDRLVALREKFADILFVSFPGDEKLSGGCLAAGRGFIHISSTGDAEPCPFSPYSDTNLKNITLKKALLSPLFNKIRSTDVLTQEHTGGCVLFEHDDIVRSLIEKNE